MVEFRVTRTSTAFVGSRKPCPEAYEGTYTEHVYCTLPLKEAMKSPRTAWFRELTNHRKAPGGCVADRESVPCWFVKLDSIDDLKKFVNKHGGVVVNWESDGPTIEIYDYYRE